MIFKNLMPRPLQVNQNTDMTTYIFVVKTHTDSILALQPSCAVSPTCVCL